MYGETFYGRHTAQHQLQWSQIKIRNEILPPVTCKANMSHLMTKPTKWHVHQAKAQISLGIHPVWSVFTVRSVGS